MTLAKRSMCRPGSGTTQKDLGCHEAGCHEANQARGVSVWSNFAASRKGERKKKRQSLGSLMRDYVGVTDRLVSICASNAATH